MLAARAGGAWRGRCRGRCKPPGRSRRLDADSHRHNRVDINIIVQGKGELLLIVGALDAPAAASRRLHGGQEQADQDGDDGDDHEQFDQCEAHSSSRDESCLSFLGPPRRYFSERRLSSGRLPGSGRCAAESLARFSDLIALRSARSCRRLDPDSPPSRPAKIAIRQDRNIRSSRLTKTPFGLSCFTILGICEGHFAASQASNTVVAALLRIRSRSRLAAPSGVP